MRGVDPTLVELFKQQKKNAKLVKISSMSSKVKGVSGRILKKNPKALYVHCSSHRLNLMVAKACTIPVVRNMLGQAKKIASFFSSSPKRGQYISKKMEEYPLNHTKLATPSTTRWVNRITALDETSQKHL